MNVYMAGVLGLLGVFLVIAGVQNRGTQLFTALAGSGTPGGGVAAGSTPAAALGAGPTTPAGTSNAPVFA